VALRSRRSSTSSLAQVAVAPEIIARFDLAYPAGGSIDLIAAWRETAFQNFERERDATPVERVVITAEIEYSAASFAQHIAASTGIPARVGQSRARCLLPSATRLTRAQTR
jgi:hypothetical protein